MTYTTPRSLLGILRLSQALARLRFSDVIAEGDVMEAIRLSHASKSSLLAHVGGERRGGASDPVTAIYDIIVSSTDADIDADLVFAEYDAVVNKAMAKGYTAAQVASCVEQYEELGVWMLNADKTRITFVN